MNERFALRRKGKGEGARWSNLTSWGKYRDYQKAADRAKTECRWQFGSFFYQVYDPVQREVIYECDCVGGTIVQIGGTWR